MAAEGPFETAAGAAAASAGPAAASGSALRRFAGCSSPAGHLLSWQMHRCQYVGVAVGHSTSYCGAAVDSKLRNNFAAARTCGRGGGWNSGSCCPRLCSSCCVCLNLFSCKSSATVSKEGHPLSQASLVTRTAKAKGKAKNGGSAGSFFQRISPT